MNSDQLLFVVRSHEPVAKTRVAIAYSTVLSDIRHSGVVVGLTSDACRIGLDTQSLATDRPSEPTLAVTAQSLGLAYMEP